MDQLLYFSRAMPDLDPSEIFRIVETSARNNPAREITGFLVFAQDRFLQLVEGPRPQLDRLLADLHRDGRHHSLDMIARTPITRRNFPYWRMQRLSLTHKGRGAVIEKLIASGLSRPMLTHIRSFIEVERIAA